MNFIDDPRFLSSGDKKKCFVIMPFREKFDEIFEYGISPAVISKEYRCVRMDKTAGPINLINEMIRNICEADLIIADLTDKSANVFYELGVAHSVAQTNNTIMIAEQDEEIPFDIAPYKVLKYTRSIKGIDILRTALGEQIEFLETSGHLTSNPIKDYLLTKKVIRQKSPSRPEPADVLLNQLNLSLARLCVLSLLAGRPADSIGLRIGDICSILVIQKRKFAVKALREMEINGIVQKKRRDKNTYWQISDYGREIFKKMQGVIRTKIVTYDNK